MFVLKGANTFFMKTDFTLDSAYDGLRLSVVAVRPETRPEAVLQVSHGMCGYKERYMPFMEYMAEHGVACVACDHRGHGASVKSSDDLGFMYEGGYAALVEDMKLVSDWSVKEFPDTPLFLLGHSMGSMAARIYTKKYDGMLSGLIVCGAPGYTPFARLGLLMTGFLCLFDHGRMRPALLQNLISYNYNRRFASEGRMAWMCSDTESRKEFLNNSASDYIFTANGMHNLLGMMVESGSDKGWTLSNPKLHVTFLSGEDDPCMGGVEKLHDSARLMYRAGYHDVTAAIFTGMRHEILNEIDRTLVWDDVLDFIHSAV